ncbi:hypothetical protein ISS40_01235 [Candidatus Bathyarchaeota archaeon]|nr:hypothetical protein [Candidatus Bathyarchaeota archaeon]
MAEKPTSVSDILDRIAIEVSEDPSQSEFLRKLAEAWLLANGENKGVLRPAWLVLIDRFRLEEARGDV